MGDHTSQNLGECLQQALVHHQAGRLVEAESLYQFVLASEPHHPEALRLRGVLAQQRGQSETARSFLEQALKAKPGSARVHVDLASALMGLKEMELAITFLQRAVGLQPFFPEAYHALGNAYAACWFLNKAQESYERALAQNPNMPALRQCLEFVRRQLMEVDDLAGRLRQAFDSASVAAVPRATIEQLPLQTRELFPHLLNQLGLRGVGAEVGVREGFFSEHLLQHWNGQLLYSIDPWIEFPTSEYRDSANVAQSKQDELYRSSIKRLLPFQGRSVIWRLTSIEGAELVPDNSLDFCYLDADHSYKAVGEDVRLWYDKVKKGGILGGHDYIPDGTYPFGTFGVQSAVNEFIRSLNLDLFLSKETPFRSWFVLKR